MSLEQTINVYCLKTLRRLPDLKSPTGYNDKIQWLKLFDQRREHITACDKIAVRRMVADTVGDEFLIPSVEWPPTEFPVIAKTSHDSGGNAVIRSEIDIPVAREVLEKRLTKSYGVKKGEWAYQFVKPAILVERLLSQATDYKFHCVHGRVAWVQIIWDRVSGYPNEAIFAPDGRLLNMHMDEKMRYCLDQSVYPGVKAWAAMTDLAVKLSAPWRYVRVDLYWSDARAWFGELTFWPRAGCYKSADEPRFGEMMKIDMSYRLPAIVS